MRENWIGISMNRALSIMKKAIVIGATSGIGRETAVRLVDEGWEVGVSGRRIEALEAFREEYGEGVHFRQMDVTQEDATARLDL